MFAKHFEILSLYRHLKFECFDFSKFHLLTLLRLFVPFIIFVISSFWTGLLGYGRLVLNLLAPFWNLRQLGFPSSIGINQDNRRIIRSWIANFLDTILLDLELPGRATIDFWEVDIFVSLWAQTAKLLHTIGILEHLILSTNFPNAPSRLLLIFLVHWWSVTFAFIIIFLNLWEHAVVPRDPIGFLACFVCFRDFGGIFLAFEDTLLLDFKLVFFYKVFTVYWRFVTATTIANWFLNQLKI